jgi:hypothetical protein
MPLVLTALALALFIAGPAAAEGRMVAEVVTPTRAGERTAFPVIDAYAGRVVWSSYDAAVDVWRLMEHSQGVTRPVPVAPRDTPFDVDLGPDGHGGTLAVYSRCRRYIRFDSPTPLLGSSPHGCDLYAYSFRTGRESPVAGANSPADETWPAVWRSRVAFVRAYRSRREQHVYWRARDAGGPSRRLRRPSPVVTVRMGRPLGTTVQRVRLPFIVDGLDMRGRSVAYAWRRVDDDETVSSVYVATTGGALRPAARGATSGGGAAVSSRSLWYPSLTAGGLHWLFVNRGEPDDFRAFLRRSGGGLRRSAPSRAVAFAHDRTRAYWIDAGPRAVNESENQPGGRFPLLADDAVAYRRVPPSWLPIPPP